MKAGDVNAQPTTYESPSFVQTAVERHQAPLLRYATRLLHGDADRARDVVQDTFVRLMAQPPAQIDGHVAEWLYTVCRNRVLDVFRKEGRMKLFETGQRSRPQNLKKSLHWLGFGCTPHRLLSRCLAQQNPRLDD